MAFLGNQPAAQFTTIPTVQRFNGTGSATEFTLDRAVTSVQSIMVSVDGVIQDTSSYTIPDGVTLTFSSAPSSGTGNIFINYLGLVLGTVTHPSTSSLSATSGTFSGNVTIAGTLGVTGIGTFTDDIIIGDGKTIGSASKVDAITIASSGLTQLRSTGIDAGSPVLQVIDDGTTILNVRAEDGNISFPVAGAGIYLGVTSGTAANLLDDYEEGTWTPTITGESGTITSYTVNSGSYTKIGDRVIAQCRFNITDKGSGSNFVLTLPTTSVNPPLGIFNETNTTGKTGFMMNTGDNATNIISRLSGWGGATLFNGNYTVSIQYKSA
jgi:hypothetical protein